MVPDAPPPHRLIASKPISTADASTMLQTYITHSEAHPHLHPDALITPTGVTFSSHGGPTGGVVMHNLRRIAAGLRGEYLEPEPTPEPEQREDDEGGEKAWKGKARAKGKKTTFSDADAGAAVEVEWQDKEAYEAEQGEMEIGDLGDRTNVVQDGGEEPHVEVSTGEKRKGEEALDKEARKKAKKERETQRKKENEKKRKDKA